jgi:hypothetical protein
LRVQPKQHSSTIKNRMRRRARIKLRRRWRRLTSRHGGKKLRQIDKRRKDLVSSQASIALARDARAAGKRMDKLCGRHGLPDVSLRVIGDMDQ